MSDIKQKYKTNLHQFDGLLEADLLPKITVSNECKKSKISELKNSINKECQPYFKILFRGFGKKCNKDSRNGISVDDLLYICSLLSHNEDFVCLLNEQLKDIALGSCPQGRACRLYQIIYPFKDFI